MTAVVEYVLQLYTKYSQSTVGCVVREHMVGTPGIEEVKLTKT